jgi:hypothetical protein
VTVTERSKNLQVSTKASAGGDFLIPGLLPGNYSITVETTGFKKLTRKDITLDANDKLAIGDLVMEVGAVTETVEVSAQAAVLQSESVERSATISGKQITNIEVNGRSPLDLAKLVPGVQFTNGSNYAVASSNGANDCTVNGARPSQNQLSINGVGDVDTGNNGGLNIAVSLDSIAEFKILSNSYQTEYGLSAGGRIALVTKSGTEPFHGSGYWQHRNDSLNANTFLNNAATCRSLCFATTMWAIPSADRFTFRTLNGGRKTNCSSSSARNSSASCLPTPYTTCSSPPPLSARATGKQNLVVRAGGGYLL